MSTAILPTNAYASCASRMRKQSELIEHLAAPSLLPTRIKSALYCQHTSAKIALFICGEHVVCRRFVAWVERRRAIKAESAPAEPQPVPEKPAPPPVVGCPHCAEISRRAGFRACCIAGWSILESEQQRGKWYYRADDTGETRWEHPSLGGVVETAPPLEKATVQGAVWMAQAPRVLIACPVCGLMGCRHFGVRAVAPIARQRSVGLENSSCPLVHAPQSEGASPFSRLEKTDVVGQWDARAHLNNSNYRTTVTARDAMTSGQRELFNRDRHPTRGVRGMASPSRDRNLINGW